MTRDFSSRARRRARWGAADRVLVTASAAVLVLSGWSALAAWSHHRHAAARVAATRQELAASRARPQVAQSRRGPQEALLRRAVLTAEAPPGGVLGALAELLPPDVRLEALTLKYSERLEIDLRVEARSPRAYDLFLSRLEESPFFEGVEPGDENREGEVRTTVRATFKGGAS